MTAETVAAALEWVRTRLTDSHNGKPIFPADWVKILDIGVGPAIRISWDDITGYLCYLSRTGNLLIFKWTKCQIKPMHIVTIDTANAVNFFRGVPEALTCPDSVVVQNKIEP